MNPEFKKSAELVLANADRLIDETVHLEFVEPATTAFYLIQLAQEEISKALILALVYRDLITWDDHIQRACRDHCCKQLLFLVMDYLQPVEDADMERHIQTLVDRRLADVPRKIADAIHILRHEKIGRRRSGKWANPNWDSEAMKIARGSLDSVKQDTIYVRLAQDGSVVSSPTQVEVPKYSELRDSADRMLHLVKTVLDEQRPVDVSLGRVEEIFRILYAAQGVRHP